MKMKSILFLLAVLAFSAGALLAQPSANLPELANILLLFSANATAHDGVRLNWSLEQQSPTILKYRLYRGYEDVGQFSVLAEIPVRAAADTVDYSFRDTTARAGVTYYYKIAAAGQSSESVFPVVISATPPLSGETTSGTLPPASILPGEKIVLYVRHPGFLHLSIVSPAKALVNDTLRPGIYEFDPPKGAKELVLRLEHEQGLKTEIRWPK